MPSMRHAFGDIMKDSSREEKKLSSLDYMK
jgi:hypothetical protein